jgi:hypothetical protein
MRDLSDQEKKMIDRYRQIAPSRRRHVLLAIADSAPEEWEQLQIDGEKQLRAIANEIGLDWDHMDDQRRKTFVRKNVGDRVPDFVRVAAQRILRMEDW